MGQSVSGIRPESTVAEYSETLNGILELWAGESPAAANV